jgi:hypothetical protein
MFNWLVRQKFDPEGNFTLSNADAATVNRTPLASSGHLDSLVDELTDNADTAINSLLTKLCSIY